MRRVRKPNVVSKRGEREKERGKGGNARQGLTQKKFKRKYFAGGGEEEVGEKEIERERKRERMSYQYGTEDDSGLKPL